VAAAAALAHAHGLRVEERAVLNDLFSVMVHLRPAPVVARVPTWISRLRSRVSDWLDREVAVTSFLSEQGGPVVAPSRELPPGPHNYAGHTISFWTYLEPTRTARPLPLTVRPCWSTCTPPCVVSRVSSRPLRRQWLTCPAG
jgi:hypothetical protein